MNNNEDTASIDGEKADDEQDNEDENVTENGHAEVDQMQESINYTKLNGHLQSTIDHNLNEEDQVRIYVHL
jgi:hypothetical protein